MNKNKIILKVSNTVEWLEDTGATLNVTSWNEEDGYMTDEHVTEHFEELESLGLDEESEGDMYYYGNTFDVDTMVLKLQSLGFTAERFDGKSF